MDHEYNPATQYAGVVPIEIQCGREGLWGIRNKNLIPIGGAVELKNATLEDHTWRTGGGAQKLGTLMEMLPHNDDEEIALVVATPEAIQQVLKKIGQPAKADPADGAKWQHVSLGMMSQMTPRRNLTVVSAPKPVPAARADDVALIGVTAEDYGLIRITMPKKK